jgi:hypothetical protein
MIKLRVRYSGKDFEWRFFLKNAKWSSMLLAILRMISLLVKLGLLSPYTTKSKKAIKKVNSQSGILFTINTCFRVSLCFYMKILLEEKYLKHPSISMAMQQL